MPLFVPDAHSAAISAWLGRVGMAPALSDFTATEFAASVSRHVRMSALTSPQGEAVLAKFDEWALRSTTRRLTGPADIAAGERLVRRFELKLQAPDALHIAIALADGATLVTFDERQAEAMRLLGDCVVPG